MTAAVLAATLIAALPSREGLVVCSDRQGLSVHDGVRAELKDDVLKLNRAGTTAVFGVTGAIIFSREGRTVFDARQAAAHTLEEGGVPATQQQTSIFAEHLLARFVSSGALAIVSPKQAESDVLFAVTLYRFRSGKPAMTRFLFFYVPGTPPSARKEVHDLGENNIDFVGQDFVPRAMTRTDDPRFKDLRLAFHAIFSKKDVSAQSVMKFARWFIRECSKRTAQLTLEPVNIGLTSDCALVSERSVLWFPSDTGHSGPSSPRTAGKAVRQTDRR